MTINLVHHVVATAIVATLPLRLPAAEKEPTVVARAFVESLNQACEHRAHVPASIRVFGRVQEPGRFDMRTSDSVWAALDRAKIDIEGAALDQIVLIRRDRTGVESRHILNWELREEYGLDPLLCDGDIIFVTNRVME